MSDSNNVENVQVLNGGEVTLDGGRKKTHNRKSAHRRSRMRGGKVAPVADVLTAESLDGGKKKKHHKRSHSRHRVYGGKAENSAPLDADIVGGAVDAPAVDQTLEGGKKHKKHHKRSHSRRRMMMYGGEAETSAADDFDAAIFGGAVEALAGLDGGDLEGGKRRSERSEKGLKAWVAAVKHENMGRVPKKGTSAYRRTKAYMNKL